MQNNDIEIAYLMLLNIKIPQAEHAKIKDKLNEIHQKLSKMTN